MSPDTPPAVDLPAENPGATPGTDGRGLALIEIALCSGLPTTLSLQALFSWLGYDAGAILSNARLTALFIFVESSLLLLLLWGLQSARRATLLDLGVLVPNVRRELLLGLLIVPGLFGMNLLVSYAFREFWPRYSTPRNPLLDLIDDPVDLMLFLLLALWAGGLKEELQRAFILQRFKVYLAAPIVGLLVWSIAFGAGHAFQGPDSAAGATLYGLLFGAVYLWRGSVIGPVVAHSLYDVSVLIGYWLLGQD